MPAQFGPDDTIDVPRQHVQQILLTHLRDDDNDRPAHLRAALLEALAADPDSDTHPLTVRSAWWLTYFADAMFVYGLDETADTTYKHPAVAAEIELQRLLEAAAPEACEQFQAEADADLAALLADDH